VFCGIIYTTRSFSCGKVAIGQTVEKNLIPFRHLGELDAHPSLLRGDLSAYPQLA